MRDSKIITDYLKHIFYPRTKKQIYLQVLYIILKKTGEVALLDSSYRMKFY